MKGTITVCAACLRASCWQDVWPCEKARTASTVDKTRKELLSLALEDPGYWEETHVE